MQIYNPTKEVIAQDVHSRNYKFDAGQVRSVPDEVGEVIYRKAKCYGLVMLDYSEKEEKQYGNFDAYKKAKAIEGLGVKLQFLNECRSQEAFGIKESIEKNASPAISMQFKVEEFERQIKEVQDQISDLRSVVKNETVAVQPISYQPKKRGRPFTKKEPVEVLVVE